MLAPSRARPELWLLAALALFSSLLPENLARLLEYRREALAQGELWRLLSGHLVHFGWRHALADGLGLLILAWSLQGVAWRWGPLIIMLGTSLGLLLVAPELQVYRGVSALVMAALAVLLRRLWQQRPAWRPGLGPLLALLAVKLAADALGLTADLSTLPAGIHVAWQAHGLGFGLGWLAAGGMQRPVAPARDNGVTAEPE